MKDREKRKKQMLIRLSEEEMQAVNLKYQNSGYKSKSEFVRAMILTGYIIRFDEKKLQEIFRLTLNVSNNVNQIAVRVNSTGNFYEEDLNQISKEVREIWLQLKSFQSSLQKLKR
jgi:hypothetical protein